MVDTCALQRDGESEPGRSCAYDQNISGWPQHKLSVKDQVSLSRDTLMRCGIVADARLGVSPTLHTPEDHPFASVCQYDDLESAVINRVASN